MNYMDHFYVRPNSVLPQSTYLGVGVMGRWESFTTNSGFFGIFTLLAVVKL